MDIPFEMPLDADGFYRRQCPQCERECKWPAAFADEPGETEQAAAPVQIHCPYCGVGAEADQWWTEDQLVAAHKIAQREVMRLAEEGLSASISRLNRTSFISASLEVPAINPPAPLIEPDDMMIVASPCHPDQHAKVLEEWDMPLHCLVCGAAYTV